MVDKVNETRRDGDLAQDLALVLAGYGRDLRKVLRLQGDGLGGQLIAKFRRQCFIQIAAPIQRDAEAAGIGLLRGSGQAGHRPGGGKKNGCKPSFFHISKLPKTNFTLMPGFFQSTLNPNPGFSFKHRRDNPATGSIITEFARLMQEKNSRRRPELPKNRNNEIKAACNIGVLVEQNWQCP